jgi:hypothetical protein
MEKEWESIENESLDIIIKMLHTQNLEAIPFVLSYTNNEYISLYLADEGLQTCSPCVDVCHRALCTVHALTLSSGFKSPTTMEITAEFKLGGNGNYRVNSATLGLLVPAEEMHALT